MERPFVHHVPNQLVTMFLATCKWCIHAQSLQAIYWCLISRTYLLTYSMEESPWEA